MVKKGRSTMNSSYIPLDIVKEIFLRLPLISLVKLKTVSKEWRSILESKNFSEMHLSRQKSGKSRRKILAAFNCDCCDRPKLSPVSVMEGDEEIVYLHCDTARPLMTCEGLVCIPEPDWVNVLNPVTNELRRFPSGPNPVTYVYVRRTRSRDPWLAYFPGYWVMGFGRDRVSGSYKVVRMFFDPVECDVLNVETGEWRKVSRPPPYEVDAGRRSVCVNGTIYWLDLGGCNNNKLSLDLDHYTHEFSGWRYYCILAFDLHTEEFRDVKTRTDVPWASIDYTSSQILNLDDRLVISTTRRREKKLEIWCLDSKEELWSQIYSICLVHVAAILHPVKVWWFTPVSVSKEGNVLICDNNKSLFKHYLHNNVTRRLSPSTCCVIISPYLENLARLNM